MSVQDLSIACENNKRHRWAAQIVDDWRESVGFAVAQGRDFFEQMMPDLTPWPTYGQNCPVCVGRLSTMGETGLYLWDVSASDRLECKYCGTVYPNDEFPETGSLTARQMGQTFTFYLTDDERRNPSDRSGSHALRWIDNPVHTSWSGILRANRGRWCIDQVLPLSRLYALTGDIACAERAAWIMDAVAKRYPHYLFHSYDGTYADCPPADVAVSLGQYPRGGRFPKETIVSAFEDRHMENDHAVLFNGFWGAGRFGCSGSDAGVVLLMAKGYDLVHEATYADGSRVISPEMDTRIRDDLIIAACDDSEHWNEINNKAGQARSLSALVGRMFNRPNSVRRAIAGFRAILEKGFHFDGLCTESPSYSAMFLNLVRDIPELLHGYSDPPEYANTQSDPIKNYDAFEAMPLYRSALEGMIRMLDPNRLYPVIGDTHVGGGMEPIHAEVLTARYDRRYASLLAATLGCPVSESGGEYALFHRPADLKVDSALPLPRATEWFPGWRVGVLRAGNPDGGTALYLNGYSMGGHRHYDTLGLIYHTHGHELVSDRGYIWDDPRSAWTKSTAAHNIVTVDGENQKEAPRDATLEIFGRGPEIEVVQAASSAYAQCDIYRRTTALVSLPGQSSYVIDIFKVRGGSTHHYGFHANGRMIRPDRDHGRGLRTAEDLPAIWNRWVDDTVELDSLPENRATWEHEGIRLDLILLSDHDRVLIGDAPGWRNCAGNQANASPIHHLLAEKRQVETSRSDFVSVMAPYPGVKCPVQRAELMCVDEKSGALMIKVELEDRTDYLVSAPDYADRTYGEIQMTGRFGFISTGKDGTPLSAYLLDGLRLSY
ncbi:MAG: hypothetical protein HOH43_06250, partial [Candidatus Latescibacteria bacterium]|nr:hypothetical protein [Candidatus Latescibacterota bacterium]